MKAASKTDLTFEQILSIVTQLPKNEKLKLAKELEKEFVDEKLTRLMNTFKTDELDLDVLNEEIESVRQEIYEKQKP